MALKTLVDWVEDNQDNLLQSIVKSHLATALAHDVSTFLRRYLNFCVRALCTAGLEVPGSKTECSLEHTLSGILCVPYQGATRLPPSLNALLAHHDAQCIGRGLATPWGARERYLRKVKERSMEEVGNLWDGERVGPIRGGGGLLPSQRRQIQQTHNQWRVGETPVPTRETLFITPKSSPIFGSSREITPRISSKTSHS